MEQRVDGGTASFEAALAGEQDAANFHYTEVLGGLAHQLLAMKGYSSTEGNKLVKATLTATQSAILAYRPPSSNGASQKSDVPPRQLQQAQYEQLKSCSDQLHELQCSPHKTLETETAVLRALLQCLHDVTSMPTDELRLSSPLTPTASAPAAGASPDSLGTDWQDAGGEDESECYDDDDPFHIPLPSAVAMADAKQFFVLAQPLTAESCSSNLVVAVEPEVKTPPLHDKAPMHCCTPLSPVPSPSSAECLQLPTDSPGVTDETGASSNAASSSTAVSTAEPGGTTSDSACTGTCTGNGGSGADGSSCEGEEKLQRLQLFLRNDNPSKVFRETLNLSPAGCRQLSDMVASSTCRVTKLCLQNNLIGDEGVAALCAGLRNSTSLLMLDLSKNAVTDCGADELVSALKLHPTLTQLQLCHNRIGDVGAVRLSELVSVSPRLSSLGLANNAIGKAGCQALQEAIAANSRLKQLQILPGNQVTEKEAKALAKALRRNNGFSLRALLDNL